MNHVVVVGGGIAGVCAAWALRSRVRVTLLAPRSVGDGASGVAAGLINPFMGRKANGTWRWAEAMAATSRLLADSGAPTAGTGLLRPAASAKQAVCFARQATRFPDDLSWMPDVQSQSPHGTLLVRNGRAVDVADLLRSLVATMPDVEVRADRLRAWHESSDGILVETDGTTLSADALVVAAGAAWTANAPDAILHGVKGQIALLEAAGAVPTPVSGGVYLAQSGPHVVVGSTFEHVFTDLSVGDAALKDLHAKAAGLVPALADAPIAGGRAGIRVTTPHSRLPLVGPVTPKRRVWCLTGLGAKGLLMGPMVAQMLAGALLGGGVPPSEIDTADCLLLPSSHAWLPLPDRLT